MTSRRLPLRPQTIALQPVGWTRKTFALAMHMTCLALFAAAVVWPVVSPLASGELEREFRPWLQAWAEWLAMLPSLQR